MSFCNTYLRSQNIVFFSSFMPYSYYRPSVVFIIFCLYLSIFVEHNSSCSISVLDLFKHINELEFGLVYTPSLLFYASAFPFLAVPFIEDMDDLNFGVVYAPLSSYSVSHYQILLILSYLSKIMNFPYYPS
ncbi:hypothetical protein CsSME_00029986 [Camellia sinensis var. sinensis]